MSYKRNYSVITKSIILIMLFIVLITLINFWGPDIYNNFIMPKNEPVIITSSMLEDAVNISKLSTAKYKYNGIAQLYENEKVKCNVKYNAEVKAGIDMKDIAFNINDADKIITVTLPEIQFSSYIIDQNSLSFIPSDSKVDLKAAIAACEKDSLDEANKSKDLKNAAEENLKQTIRALLYPLLETTGYTIQWG
ncbi:DUF4230 domain-containing protein [Oribacterium sp. FC2011]|uniref:DUF4230 domain-containing protein n=1 Tax=Oribacterium sp. FC2011 TaxID=1408311 RepID=UPI0004E1C26F|nr:DUF4230 domain-containing protein [Oribacterium sp. FC2011]